MIKGATTIGASTLSPSTKTATGGGGGAGDSILWGSPYVVSSDADAPYQTIQAAIDAVAADSPGRADILIEPGTYTENLNLDALGDQIVAFGAFIGAQNVRAPTFGAAPEGCSVEVVGAGHSVAPGSGTPAVVSFDSFRFRPNAAGPGWTLGTDAYVEWRNCHVTAAGGAIVGTLGSEIRLQNCEVRSEQGIALESDEEVFAYDTVFFTESETTHAVRIKSAGTAFLVRCELDGAFMTVPAPDAQILSAEDNARVWLVGLCELDLNVRPNIVAGGNRRAAKASDGGSLFFLDGVDVRGIVETFGTQPSVTVKASSLTTLSGAPLINHTGGGPIEYVIVRLENCFVRGGTSGSVKTLESNVQNNQLEWGSTLSDQPIEYDQAAGKWSVVDLTQTPTAVP